MSFVLEPEEPLGQGLRRVLKEETAGAAEGLEQASESDWEEAVHEARKSLKKSRAIVRLTRSAMGPLYGEANTLLRDIGRSLSVVRDAGVMVTTIDKLAETTHEPTTGNVIEPIRQILLERRDRVREIAMTDRLQERTSQGIRRADDLLTKMAWERMEWAVVETGLRREYGRGRSALREARRDPDGEATHEWRKRVKDHWYHVRLLRKLWTPVLKRTATAAHTVSDLLGDEHDLAVLMDDLRTNRGKLWEPARADFLRTLAERHRGELFAAAVSKGLRLYAEKPGRFAARIRRYREAADSEVRVHGDLETTAAGG